MDIEKWVEMEGRTSYQSPTTHISHDEILFLQGLDVS